jgi:phenylacetate-CoA ligase
MNSETLYRRLPAPLQNLACSAQGWRMKRSRFGRGFHDALAAGVTRCSQPLSVLQSERTCRLRLILESASHSPFWQERFRTYDIDPKGPDPFLQLERLPILSKAEVQAHANYLRPNLEFLRSVTQKPLVKCHTSGTTGSGLIFFSTAEAEAERWATWWRYRQWHGLDMDRWCGTFAGRSVIPQYQSTPPYWRINRPGRQVLFSAYHLSEQTAPLYLAEVQRRQLPWLHGYPSILALVAGYAVQLGFDFSSHLRIVTTGAESLLPHQRQLIEHAFGVAVRDHYGQAEGVANISERPDGQLQVDEDYSIVEFLPTHLPGQYRIIGTTLTNPAFPLLRYDTQDIATVTDDSVWQNPSSWRLVDSVDGRREDYLILSDGSKVGRLDHILKDMVEITEAQFYQRLAGEAELRIVPGPHYNAAVQRRLMQEIDQRLGDRIHIQLCIVSHIQRTATGKLRFVISDIPEARI